MSIASFRMFGSFFLLADVRSCRFLAIVRSPREEESCGIDIHCVNSGKILCARYIFSHCGYSAGSPDSFERSIAFSASDMGRRSLCFRVQAGSIFSDFITSIYFRFDCFKWEPFNGVATIWNRDVALPS